MNNNYSWLRKMVSISIMVDSNVNDNYSFANELLILL